MDINAANMATMPIWWPNDILIGIIFFSLGIGGAMIVVYLGDWEKLMRRSVRIVEIEEDIREKKKRANKPKEDKTSYRETWELINRDQDRLDRERKFNITLEITLYLLIGGVVATILADSAIEAVAFGAGWTGLIGVFGLKKDSEERAEVREEETTKQEKDFREISKKNIDEAYYRGYSDAIERIAKIENISVEKIIEKFK
ncbi:MAG: hypothetical protein BA871_10270 [Desulfuromonadales bacterium C00003096]|jgi:hypothetical protein|nr:MAG: hypothetical protein BA871_10270 [Desulfuromonadales bacterium C00003096]